MKFEIVGDIEQVETIASGRGVKISDGLSYIGTTPTESVAAISRSRG